MLFENPALVGRAFRDAFGKLQVGRRSAEANEAYRELLELGVVNSQVQLGDIKNLLSDVRMGENLNIAKPLESIPKSQISSNTLEMYPRTVPCKKGGSREAPGDASKLLRSKRFKHILQSFRICSSFRTRNRNTILIKKTHRDFHFQ